MYTHVVLFRFKQAEDAVEAAERLNAMRGQIPSLREIEVGIDDAPSPRSAHLCLITRFDDADGLETYRVHPIHQTVVEWISAHATESVKVDFAGDHQTESPS